jgi:hypothetical protein
MGVVANVISRWRAWKNRDVQIIRSISAERFHFDRLFADCGTQLNGPTPRLRWNQLLFSSLRPG